MMLTKHTNTGEKNGIYPPQYKLSPKTKDIITIIMDVD